MTFNGRRTQIITGRSEAAVEVVKDDFLVDEMREVRRAEVVTEAAIAPDNDFLGWVTFFEGESGEGILEGVDDLNFTCLGFDYIDFNSIGIFFAGVLFRNFSKDGEVTLFFLFVFICVARPPAFLHGFSHFPQIY